MSSRRKKEKKKEKPIKLFSNIKEPKWDLIQTVPGFKRDISKIHFGRVDRKREAELRKIFESIPKKEQQKEGLKIVASTEDGDQEPNKKPVITSNEPVTSRPKVRDNLDLAGVT